MIRVCSVSSFRSKFNIDLSFSEMRRLYWTKFINGYTQREKESGRVHEKNYENSKLIRPILVVICDKMYLYDVKNFGFMKFYRGNWSLCPLLYFCNQKKTFNKLSKMLFILPKKLLLSSTFSNFCTSLFPMFFFS